MRVSHDPNGTLAINATTKKIGDYTPDFILRA